MRCAIIIMMMAADHTLPPPTPPPVGSQPRCHIAVLQPCGVADLLS
jgi:hypothetical protein